MEEARYTSRIMDSHPSGSLFSAFAIVLALIIVAALFVAAEIAQISLRESQVKQMALRGKRGARVAKLASNPNRLLAAAQVGVTFCGFLSAALGAEKLGVHFIPWLVDRGISEKSANTISLVTVTIVIAYVSLVLGELVPKRLALFRTETIALWSAPVVDVIANIFRPIIWLLSKSTDFVVRIFGIDPKEQREQMSEEELLDLVAGHAALTEEERDIVEEVFNASERQVHEVMVPRTEVDFIDGISTDPYGVSARKELERDGVGLSLALSSDKPTCTATVTLDAAGSASYEFLIDGTATFDFNSSWLPDPYRYQPQVLHIGTLVTIIEPGASALYDWAMQVAEFAPIVFDPNVRSVVMSDRDKYLAAVERWVAISSVVKVSDDDMAWLYPGVEYAEAFQIIRWIDK